MRNSVGAAGAKSDHGSDVMKRRCKRKTAVFTVLVLILMFLTQPVFAAVDTEVLEDALPGDAQELLDGISPETPDLDRGLEGLWTKAKAFIAEDIRQALLVGLLMLGACMFLSLTVGFAGESGLSIPEKLTDFTAVAVLLTIYLSSGSSLINECVEAIGRLDTFVKVLTPVYAAVSALAGRPVSAVATGEITLMFSAVVFWFCQYIILPGISVYVLLDSIGGLVPVGILGKLAELLRWCVSKGMKWLLTGFTAYQTLSGMITKSTDALAVKTAQTAITSLIPVVGGLISSTSDALLGGANLLRTGVGIYGFLSVCAICLGPIVRAAVHFFVFKILTACGSAYLGGAAAKTIRSITDGYGMALGALGMCCMVEFIAIVVSTVVTAS